MQKILGEACEVPEGASKSYQLIVDDKTVELFIVHYQGEYYGYENHCPHTGVNLNWQPDQFLDISESRIQCATHGALFRITDGLCEWGPCLGKHLRTLKIEQQNGQLILLEALSDSINQ